MPEGLPAVRAVERGGLGKADRDLPDLLAQQEQRHGAAGQLRHDEPGKRVLPAQVGDQQELRDDKRLGGDQDRDGPRVQGQAAGPGTRAGRGRTRPAWRPPVAGSSRLMRPRSCRRAAGRPESRRSLPGSCPMSGAAAAGWRRKGRRAGFERREHREDGRREQERRRRGEGQVPAGAAHALSRARAGACRAWPPPGHARTRRLRRRKTPRPSRTARMPATRTDAAAARPMSK